MGDEAIIITVIIIICSGCLGNNSKDKEEEIDIYYIIDIETSTNSPFFSHIPIIINEDGSINNIIDSITIINGSGNISIIEDGYMGAINITSNNNIEIRLHSTDLELINIISDIPMIYLSREIYDGNILTTPKWNNRGNQYLIFFHSGESESITIDIKYDVHYSNPNEFNGHVRISGKLFNGNNIINSSINAVID